MGIMLIQITFLVIKPRFGRNILKLDFVKSEFLLFIIFIFLRNRNFFKFICTIILLREFMIESEFGR